MREEEFFKGGKDMKCILSMSQIYIAVKGYIRYERFGNGRKSLFKVRPKL